MKSPLSNLLHGKYTESVEAVKLRESLELGGFAHVWGVGKRIKCRVYLIFRIWASSRLSRGLLAIGLLFASSAVAQGEQDLRIGVIVSQSGLSAVAGQTQAQAAAALAARWETDFFGKRIALELQDDGSSSVAAVRLAEELLDSGIHALVCCTTEAATEAVASVAEAAGVLMLTPGPLPEENTWAYGIRPDTATFLRSALLQLSSLGKPKIALMTLNTELGDEVLDTLSKFTVPGGAELVGTQRYRDNVNVLTPEALWIATRQPGSVLIWGTERDSSLALTALRARGFEGPVLLRPGVTVRGNSSNLISPYEFAAKLNEDHPSFASVVGFERALAQLYGPGKSTLEGAYLYDALLIIRAGLEQALVYGVDPADTQRFRGALYDAFLASSEVAGVTAVFDFSPDSFNGVQPYSLLLVERNGAELTLLSETLDAE